MGITTTKPDIITDKTVDTNRGETEWVMGELLTDSIHWKDGQVICWPSPQKGAESLGEYISWADSFTP